MSRLIKSVFLAFQEYSRLFFVQFKCISIVTESIFRVCLNVQCQWRSRVPVQRTHAFLPARVLAHDLRQLLLDPGPDVLSGPVVAQPARGLRGCGGGTPTSKSCEVMSKCRMQCNKMASANATLSPESWNLSPRKVLSTFRERAKGLYHLTLASYTHRINRQIRPDRYAVLCMLRLTIFQNTVTLRGQFLKTLNGADSSSLPWVSGSPPSPL